MRRRGVWSLFKFGWDTFGHLQNVWTLIVLAGLSGTALGVWAHIRGMSAFEDTLISIGVFAAVAFILFCITVIRAYREKKDQESPLEIIFDPSNPGRKFWSIESMPNPNDTNGKPIVYWEHRVEIRNNSSETARNVQVKVEGIGPMPMFPTPAEFVPSKTKIIDIQPKCSEFVWINRWSQPKEIVGMLANESAWAYGPHRIIASADNMIPAVRDFEFNWCTEQMFFDKRPEYVTWDTFKSRRSPKKG